MGIKKKEKTKIIPGEYIFSSSTGYDSHRKEGGRGGRAALDVCMYTLGSPLSRPGLWMDPPVTHEWFHLSHFSKTTNIKWDVVKFARWSCVHLLPYHPFSHQCHSMPRLTTWKTEISHQKHLLRFKLPDSTIIISSRFSLSFFCLPEVLTGTVPTRPPPYCYNQHSKSQFYWSFQLMNIAPNRLLCTNWRLPVIQWFHCRANRKFSLGCNTIAKRSAHRHTIGFQFYIKCKSRKKV